MLCMQILHSEYLISLYIFGKSVLSIIMNWVCEPDYTQLHGNHLWLLIDWLNKRAFMRPIIGIVEIFVRFAVRSLFVIIYSSYVLQIFVPHYVYLSNVIRYTFCFLSFNLDSLHLPLWLHVLTPPQSFCAGVYCHHVGD